MTTFKVDEKLELCKELGLENLVHYFNETKKMTDLNFKEITSDEINNKIHSHVRKTEWYKNCMKVFKKRLSVIPSIFILIPTIFFMIFMRNCSVELKIIFTAAFGGINLLLVPFMFDAFPFINIRSVPIKEWRYDIPYGALLSMKEAKEKGISNFEVFYLKKLKRKTLS